MSLRSCQRCHLRKNSTVTTWCCLFQGGTSDTLTSTCTVSIEQMVVALKRFVESDLQSNLTPGKTAVETVSQVSQSQEII